MTETKGVSVRQRACSLCEAMCGLEVSVLVRSRAGSVEVPVQVTDEMMPGVVCLPYGWGHDKKGVRLSVAARRPRRQ